LIGRRRQKNKQGIILSLPLPDLRAPEDLKDCLLGGEGLLRELAGRQGGTTSRFAASDLLSSPSFLFPEKAKANFFD
jgi:hypothetical protein